MPQQTTQPATQTRTTVVVGENAYSIPAAEVPRNGAEVRALERRIDVMRDQLQDAAARRNTVASNLRSADEQARQGYIERLEVLDERILNIEKEISNSVARLAAAPAFARNEASSMAAPAPEQIAQNVQGALESAIPIVAIISVFFLFPMALAVSRFIWKRSTAPAVRAGPDRETLDRMNQLQQSMDAIAIEVERISEGQRFVTKLMADRQIGSGAAEPIAQKQAVRSESR